MYIFSTYWFIITHHMIVGSVPNYTHAPPPENLRKRKTTSHDIATWQRRRVPEVCSELEILAGFAPDWWKKRMA